MPGRPFLNDSRLPLAALSEVEAVCVAFEEALGAGRSPQIDEFLARVDPALRPVLLPELREIERDHRGDKPPGDDLPTDGWRQATLAGAASTRSHGGRPFAPAQPPDRLPRPFGEYTLLSILGRGGMGIVYLARQQSVDRLVALKLIPPDQLAGLKPDVRTELLTRFRNEALAAAQLEHEQIVGVYDVGEIEEQPYYTMRFVDGPSLTDVLGEGPLANKRAAAWFEPVARAVHQVHLRGILHRDLKPRNILLESATDRLFVADFGLAKLIERASDVTHSGQCVGTPSYISPEQARDASKVTAATDVYGLGATLYHMLTGRPPFQAASVTLTIAQVLDKPPLAPRELNPAIDRDLDTICLKCLEKEPTRRYDTAESLADDLARYLRGEPIVARPIGMVGRALRWRRRNPIVAALSALVFVSLIAGTGVSWYFALQANSQAAAAFQSATTARNETKRADGEAAESRRRLARMNVDEGWQLFDRGDRLAAMVRFAEALSIERDQPDRAAAHRRRLAFLLADSPTIERLWLHSGPIAYAEFSPDGGRVVAAGMDGTARVWGVATGDPIGPIIAHEQRVTFAGFSPDGSRILSASLDGSAQLWDAETGQAIGPALEPGEPVLHAAFSPDGRLVATASGRRMSFYGPGPPVRDGSGEFRTKERASYVKIWDASSGELIQEVPHGGWVQHVEFSPDGLRVVASVGQLENTSDGRKSYAQVHDAATGEPLGSRLVHEVEVLMARFSPDGMLVATASGDVSGHTGEARLFDAHTGEAIGSPMAHESRVSKVEFNPDGDRLLTASWDGTARQWQVPGGEPAGDPRSHTAEIVEACYSRDGQWIATGDREGVVQVFSATPDGIARPPLVHSGEIARLEFGRDSQSLLVGCGDGTLRIWALPPPAKPHTIQGTSEDVIAQATFDDAGRLIVASGFRVNTILSGARGDVSHTTIVPRRISTWELTGTEPVAAWSGSGRGGQISHVDYDRGEVVTIAIRSGSSVVQLRDLATGDPVGAEINCPGQVHDAVLDSQGNRMITGSTDKMARVWDAATARELTPALSHDLEVSRVVLSPDDRWLVTVLKPLTRRPTVTRVWDLANAQATSSPRDHAYAIEEVVFNPDGVRYAVAGDRVEIWKADAPADGQPLATIRQPARHVSFSKDGKLLLTFGATNAARVWDSRTGEPASPPLSHAGEVRHAAFSGDGRFVATAGSDGIARVWDAASGEPITPPLVHADLVWHVEFDKSGERIVTCAADEPARIWNLLVEDRPIESLLDLTALVAGSGVDETGGLARLNRDELMGRFIRLQGP